MTAKNTKNTVLQIIEDELEKLGEQEIEIPKEFTLRLDDASTRVATIGLRLTETGQPMSINQPFFVVSVLGKKVTIVSDTYDNTVLSQNVDDMSKYRVLH